MTLHEDGRLLARRRRGHSAGSWVGPFWAAKRGLQAREVSGRLDPELAQGLDHLLLDGRGRELVAPILMMRDVLQVGHRDDRRSEQDERVELDIGVEPPDACALGRGGEAAVSDEAARLRISETMRYSSSPIATLAPQHLLADDNPFERNIVRQFLPEVVVPDLPRTRPSISRPSPV